MSEQERHEALGKAVTDYATVKSELALSTEKGERLSESLFVVGTYFGSHQGGMDRGWVHRGNPLGTLVSALPEKAEMEKLASDILRLRARKTELASILRAAGMEPKE